MRRLTSFVPSLVLATATFAHAQDPAPRQNRPAPQVSLQIWGSTFVDFNTRVAEYADLRREIETGLAPLPVSGDPAQVQSALRARAKRVRTARASAHEGDIFTPAISASFKRALAENADAETCDALMDDNPGEIILPINASYPDWRPLSTVPPNVLAVLPKLPDDLHYRFMGRHLVLIDGRSGVILDRIRFAVSCKG